MKIIYKVYLFSGSYNRWGVSIWFIWNVSNEFFRTKK